MPVPMIDDIELGAVQVLRQETVQGYHHQTIAGLDGTLQQSLGRRSHRVLAAGVFLPESATDDLAALQKKASAGDEVIFVADISAALEIQKMVIESFAAEQIAGPDRQIAYALMLAESPELPPPAEVSAFGGLDDFGLGDMGFDTDALADMASQIADQAGELMDAVDAVSGAIDQLSALASLGDLGSVGNPAQPVSDALSGLAANAGSLTAIADAAAKLAGG